MAKAKRETKILDYNKAQRFLLILRALIESETNTITDAGKCCLISVINKNWCCQHANP